MHIKVNFAFTKLVTTATAALLIVGCSAGVKKDDKGSTTQTPNTDTTSPSAPTAPPPAPIVLLPSTLTPITNTNIVTVSGACTVGASVDITGPITHSIPCLISSFSYDLTQSSDGTYDYSIAQSNSVGSSTAVTISWTRDTIAPSAPVVTSPATSPYYSSSTNINLVGSCEDGALVDVSYSGASLGSMVCTSSTFGFNISQATDGTYNLVLKQTDVAGNTSANTNFQVVISTVVPNAPTITTPATNPYKSNTNSVTIGGACVTGYTVNLSGASTGSTSCTSSVYSFTVPKSTDGSYNFNVTQTSLSSLTSGAASTTWIRDTVAPVVPVITSPSTNPKYTNTSNLTLTGTCEANATVILSGASSSSTTCSAGGGFSFNLTSAADGQKNYLIHQVDTASNSSGNASFSWIVDTAIPAPVVVTTPTTSPITTNTSSLVISGSCEDGATVAISGALSSSGICTGSAFTFTDNKSSDSTYNYSIVQTDLSGNTGTATTVQWIRDTAAPAIPNITSPSISPKYTNTTTLTLSGTCEANATVILAGANSLTTSCSAGSTFSFSLSNSADGQYDYTIHQIDVANNSSGNASFSWVLDRAAPAALALSAPTSNPFYSSTNNVSIAGSCENGAIVDISYLGSSIGTTTCSSNAFGFNINQAIEGTYDFILKQTDSAGNSSTNTNLQVVISTTAPSAPTITTPATSPYQSNLNSLTISGACVTGYTVNLTGAAISTTTCASNVYSFDVPKSTDGTYSFSVTQTSLSSLTSTSADLTWIRDTVVPSAPAITSPAVNPKYSNVTSLTLTGTCEPNDSVVLSGASSSTMNCTAGGTFSFNLTSSTDGQKDYLIHQIDAANNSSPNASFSWIVDTTAPAPLTITSPTSSPITTGDTSFIISGSCENGAIVSVSGSMNSTATCASSSFTFTDSQTTDTTYNYSLIQTDLAGNASSQVNVQWVRDTTIPTTPIITTPSVDPYYSNSNSLTLSGTCTGGNTVYLGGNITAGEVSNPAGSLTTTCDGANSFTFTFTKATDGTYNFNVLQESVSLIQSAAAVLVWNLDTVAPSTPTITSPSTSSYTSPGSNLTIQGACEVNATVHITGASTQNAVCSSGTYSFIVNNSVDGTYNYNINQTDLAGNNSAIVTQQWIRNGNSTPPPVISSPSLATTYSKTSNITISGTCDNTYQLTLYGDVIAPEVTSPAGTLIQTCTGGTFTYTVQKSSDGIYNLMVKQTQNSIDSSPVTKTWVRDTVAPALSSISGPLVKSAGPAVFAYSATDANTVTFTCALDGGAATSCASPYTITAPSIAAHSLVVTATDAAGNAVSSSAYTWTQVYKTLSLYHFDDTATNPTVFTDSSLYANNGLTNISTLASTTTTSKKVGTKAVRMTAISGQGLSLANNANLDMTSTRMTIEGWFRISSLPATGKCIPLATKSGPSGFSWEFRMCNTGGIYNLKFRGSTNGTTWTEITSKNLPTQAVNTYYHYVVQYDRGTVTFFYNGTAYTPASNVIGTAGSTILNVSSSALMVGSTGNTADTTNILYSGRIDEFRISQLIRYTTSFTPSTTAYSAVGDN